MKRLLTIVMGLLICAGFTSCGDDDEDKEGKFSGYWIPSEFNEVIRNTIEDDMCDDDGGIVGLLTFKFLNSNTLEKFNTDCSLRRQSGCYHQETIAGRTVYFNAEAPSTTYTYVIQDSKIIITDGTIGSLIGSEIHIDGISLRLKKLCD